MNDTNILSQKEHALQYLDHGWNVIPLGAISKIPNGKALIETGQTKIRDDGSIGGSWEVFKEQEVERRLVENWWSSYEKSNIGIVTGGISKLIVVDIDPRNGGDISMKDLHLPATYIVKTGGGGWHYYYSWNHERKAPNKTGYRKGIDLQGDGAYVVAPPSIHDKTKEAYSPVNSVTEITEAPDWLLSINDTEEEKLWDSGSNGVDVGSRNSTAASICGKILKSLPKKLWKTAGWGGLKEWNSNLKTSLSENELRNIFDSIKKRAESDENFDDESKPSIAKKIVDLVLKQKPEFLHNDLDVPFVSITVDDHIEVHSMRSQRFRNWIVQQYWKDIKKPPKSEHVKQAIDLMSSLALFEGETISLSNRVAQKDNTFWYDLCDKQWRAIQIGSAGWKLIDSPPILFRRYKHQKTQVVPETEGSVSDIMKYVNIADRRQQLLLQVYLVTALIPNIPHPIPVLYGSQGSAKSTFLRVLRRIIDPSSIELLTFPTRKDQLVQQLSHHWSPFYDNVTSIPEWLSDSLCRAVTGEGFSKRELYTDDEDVIYAFKCCIGINGINIAAQKADLLDRSILFALERIPSDERKDEQTFWREFEEDRPRILGAAFLALSKAITIKPTIVIDKLPRMADFALWGCAVAETLGYSQEEFLAAYQANINEQNEEAIREHPVATAVRGFIEEKGNWSGTPTELLDQLNTIAEHEKIDIRQKLWPKAAQSLSRRLNEAKTNLGNVGIIINMTHGSKRIITITVNRNTVDTVDELLDTNGNDDTNDTSEADAQATLKIIQEELDPKAHFID
jgi:hypothetical protein